MPALAVERVDSASLEAHLEEVMARLAFTSLAAPLEECGQVLRTEFGENIDQAEDSSGIGWPPHAPATVAKYGPHPLLILTRRMYASLTGKSADGNITRVDDRSAEFGTDLHTTAGFFYPGIHQTGGPRIPRREFFYAGNDVEEKMGEILADFIDREVI